MFSENTEKLVDDLIQAEYDNACNHHGEKYHSLHEGYAVLLEEVEEVKEINKPFNLDLMHLWVWIKKNNIELAKLYIDSLINSTENAIKELAQVGAVLQKIKNTLEVEE